MKRIAAAIAATTLAAVLVAPAYADLVTNGSFEDTSSTFVGNGSDYMVLNVGSTIIPGWTVINNPLAWIGPSNPFGLSASQGSFFLDLTSDTNTVYGGVSQTITTVAGGHYQLTYDLGGSITFGVPDSITACAGSSPCQLSAITTTSTNQWNPEILNFTATGTSTLITLSGTAGEQYIGLDNVDVKAVPLPNSLVLLGTGLFAAGALFFRRRKTTYQQALFA